MNNEPEQKPHDVIQATREASGPVSIPNAGYDDMYVYPAEVMVSYEGVFPRGLPYIVNNDSGLFQDLSRDGRINRSGDA